MKEGTSMRTRFRSRWVGSVAVGLLLGAVGYAVVREGESGASGGPPLVLHREDPGQADAAGGGGDPSRGAVVPDALRRKFDPSRLVEFGVSSSEEVSVFVEASGVQVWTPTGWKVEVEELRGNIWRLKAGTRMEVCVERPPSPVWRAYVRYGREIQGWPLLKVRLREAWLLRSFSNWSGKAWGGGRFGGHHEVYSDEVVE